MKKREADYKKARISLPGEGWSARVIQKADENGICICKVTDLPAWHFQHRGIAYGYRYCKNVNSALLSSFYWHNESINIWSHVCSCIYLLAHFWYHVDIFVLLYPLLPLEETETPTPIPPLLDRAIVAFVFVFGNVMPLLASAGCHCFYCVNKKTHCRAWFIDFWAILTGMLLNGLGYVYFAFYCNKVIAYAFTFILLLFYGLSWHWCASRYFVRLAKKTLIPRDRFPEFSFSLSTYVAFASFIPVTVTWFLQEEYTSNDEYYLLALLATFIPIFLSFGVVFFAQGGVPERFCRVLSIQENIFDFLGHSHQLWHLVTAYTMFSLESLLLQHYLLRSFNINSCLN